MWNCAYHAYVIQLITTIQFQCEANNTMQYHTGCTKKVAPYNLLLITHQQFKLIL